MQILSIPSLFRGGRNKLTTDTAHARVGTIVHTQLVWSSLWKKKKKTKTYSQAQLWNYFHFPDRPSKTTIKQELFEDSLKEQKEGWRVGWKGNKTAEEWSGYSFAGVGLILLNLRCQDVSFHPELY